MATVGQVLDAVQADEGKVTVLQQRLAAAGWLQTHPAPSTGPFYASPTGSASNPGTETQPWNLATALNGGPTGVQVTPGATIYFRGGTYGTGAETVNAPVSGSSSAPVLIKPFPGEHVIFDLTQLNVNGSWARYINDSLTIPNAFEIKRSTASPDTTDLIRMQDAGDGVKLIHLVVHDAGGVGIAPQSEIADHEVYGNVVYNNGRSPLFAGTGAAGHGIYPHGTTTAGQTRKILANIVFDNIDYGIHCFSDTGNLQNFDVEDNICFQNSVSPGLGQDFLVGGQTALTNAVVSKNVVMRTDKGPAVTIGYLAYSDPGALCVSPGVVQQNYVAGGVTLGNWDSTTLNFSNNTIVSTDDQALKVLFQGASIASGSFTMGGNAYATLASAGFGVFAIDVGPGPSETTYDTLAAWQAAIGKDATSTYTAADNLGTQTFLKPSAYVTGRGHLAIHNPTSASVVNKDISTVVAVGHGYAIYDVYDLSSPILSGTYAGGTVSVPMTGTGKTPPAVIGGGFTPVNGHPTVGAYVVLQTS